MDLLYAMRDLGVVAPAVGDAGDQRARAALAYEIEHAADPNTSSLWVRVLRRRGPVFRVPRGRRRVAALATAGVLVACSGVAVATVVDPWSQVSVLSPANLFADNPSNPNSDNPPNTNIPVIAASVKELGTINVSGVGTFQYWGGQTTDSQRWARNPEGRWCLAFRAPDGTWVNTVGSAENGQWDSLPVKPNYASGGDVPGCGVLPPNDPGGFDFQGGGFHYSTDTISPLPDAQSTTSWVYYGIVDDPGSATTVVDATSGTSTPILTGGVFALVLPSDHPEPVRLEAVDGSGNVISRAYPTGGNYPLAAAQYAYREQRLLTAAQTARSTVARDEELAAYRQERLNAARAAAFWSAREHGLIRAWRGPSG